MAESARVPCKFRRWSTCKVIVKTLTASRRSWRAQTLTSSTTSTVNSLQLLECCVAAVEFSCLSRRSAVIRRTVVPLHFDMFGSPNFELASTNWSRKWLDPCSFVETVISPYYGVTILRSVIIWRSDWIQNARSIQTLQCAPSRIVIFSNHPQWGKNCSAEIDMPAMWRCLHFWLDIYKIFDSL